MIDYKKIPLKGTMYAVYRDKIVFQKYDATNELFSVAEKDLLELHMFDMEKEYRVFCSEVYGVKAIEISDDVVSHEDTYEEIVSTEGNGKVTIVNYLSFTEDDMLMINNYRLKEVQ